MHDALARTADPTVLLPIMLLFGHLIVEHLELLGKSAAAAVAVSFALYVGGRRLE